MPEKVTVNYLVMEDLMAMSEFHAPVDKILFLKKKNIVLIRGMPFCDGVLFHLKTFTIGNILHIPNILV